MQNVTLHKGALRHPSFGMCMCAPGTVMQENSNTLRSSEIFWELLKFVSAATCLGLAMDGPLRVQLHSWPGWPWVWIHWWNCGFTQSEIRIERRQKRQRQKTKKENEEKRAEDDHISFEIFSQKMPEILKWCLCGNTHCTPSVVLLAFWIGQIVFPTSEYLCPELCHNDQLLMTSGKTLVNFSLCDSLWFFVILCDSLLFYPFLNFVRNA